MKFKLKSLTKLLFIAPLLLLVIPFNTSCGIDLMGRKTDPSVYATTFHDPVDSWNLGMVETVQTSTVVDNTSLPLVYMDRFGNYQGGIAEDGPYYPSNPSLNPATEDLTGWNWNSNDKVWTFTLRKNTYWVDHHGKTYDEILPSNYINTIKYLLNPQVPHTNTFTSAWKNSNVQSIGALQSYIKSYQFIIDVANDILQNGDFYLIKTDPESEDDACEKYTYNGYTWTVESIDNTEHLSYEVIYQAGGFDKRNVPLYGPYIDQLFADWTATVGNNHTLHFNAGGTTGPAIMGWNNQDYILKIYLAKEMNSLNFLSFAEGFFPIADKGIDANNLATAFQNYSEYTDVLYCGAYLPKKITASVMILEANPAFWGYATMDVKKVIFVNDNNNKSKAVSLFYAGDVNHVELNTTDQASWQKLVGDDINDPIFSGIHKSEITDSRNSWIEFSFWPHGAGIPNSEYNVLDESGNDLIIDDDGATITGLFQPKEKLGKANRAAALRSARIYMASNLKRSFVATKYSLGDGLKFDPNNGTSSVLSNTIVSTNLIADEYGMPYFDYIKEVCIAEYSKINSALSLGYSAAQIAYMADQIDLGHDAFYTNPFFILNAFGNFENDVWKWFSDVPTALQDNIKNHAKANVVITDDNWNPELLKIDLGEYVNIQLTGVGITDTVEIPYGLDPNADTTFNPAYNDTFYYFNANSDKNHVRLKFKGLVAPNHDRYYLYWYYQGDALTGLETGWTNGYPDIDSSLRTVVGWEGDWTDYQSGLKNVFKASGTPGTDDWKLDYNFPNTSQPDWFTSGYTKAFDELKRDTLETMNKLAQTAFFTDEKARLVANAQAEYAYIFKTAYSIPWFAREQSKMILSYLEPNQTAFNVSARLNAFDWKISNHIYNAYDYHAYQYKYYVIKYGEEELPEPYQWNDAWGTKPTPDQVQAWASEFRNHPDRYDEL